MNDAPPLEAVLIGIAIAGVILGVFGVWPEVRVTKRLGMRSFFAILAWVLFSTAWLICPISPRHTALWAEAYGEARAWTSIILQLTAIPFAYLGLRMRVSINDNDAKGQSWWWRRY